MQLSNRLPCTRVTPAYRVFVPLIVSCPALFTLVTALHSHRHAFDSASTCALQLSRYRRVAALSTAILSRCAEYCYTESLR
eukprot:1184092-Prorocentrum_minimum.AAC.1